MPRDDGFAMSWYVKVDGRVYGPYTAAQMRAFVTEGRVATHSMVSETRDDGWREASHIAQFKAWLDEARQSPNDKGGDKPQRRSANFVIIAEVDDEHRAGFEAALADFGDAEGITSGVWLLRGAASAADLRNELSHLLGREDKLLVVDASRDRTAWFNLGQDADQRIRELWGRPQ
ncbi:MAG: DUF4339 domain-containing protein [Pseudomonadota bacterium]